MNKIIGKIKENYYALAPFLISLYAVLFLYTQNQQRYLLTVLTVPIIVSLVFSAVMLGVSILIFKRLDGSVFVSSIIVFLSLSYGRFVELLEKVSLNLGSVEVTPAMIVSFVFALIILSAFYAVFKIHKKFVPVNKLIVVLASILVLIQLVSIISFEATSGRAARAPRSTSRIETKVVPNVITPDVYYFIFDRYAGPTAIKEQYGFDNSAFYNYLTDSGFYIADKSRTNYPKTFLSLSSSLNMEYLDALTKQTVGGASKDESLVTPLIENSKVLKFFKDKGYSYVQVGSWWQPTKNNKNADFSYAPVVKEYFGADEFTAGFFNTTVASSLLKFVMRNPVDVSTDPENNIHRQAALYQFNVLDEVDTIKSPKFVFVHVLLPHDPFVFDKDCNPISEKIVKKNSHQVNYLNQLQCTNTQIKKIIDRLKKSQNPPIIVLQSDEGPFPMNSSIDSEQAWSKATDTALAEKFPILNAYYFPGKNYEETELYKEISPVNSFKVLFNTYFGTDYKLEEDKSYVFKDEENYYNFTDVTDRLK